MSMLQKEGMTEVSDECPRLISLNLFNSVLYISQICILNNDRDKPTISHSNRFLAPSCLIDVRYLVAAHENGL